MEHRYHERIALGLEMLIYRGGLPVATGHIRDASRGGVFLETGYQDLREHQLLEFEFRLNGERPATRHRIAGHVRRRSPNGVALEVDDNDRDVRRVMGSLIAVRNSRAAGARTGSRVEAG